MSSKSKCKYETLTSISSLYINAFLNVLKQCCNIVFPLIIYPFVARVLGAENFGKYSFADSIVGYFTLFASLGISTYAIREGAQVRNNKKEIEILSSELFSINLITMFVSYCLLFILTFFVGRLKENILLISILSINILTNIIGRDWINSIYEDFLYISIRYIFFQFLALVLIFLTLRRPEDYIKYTCIMTFANSGGYIANLFYTKKYIPFKITNNINIKKHFKPILYLFCSTLAITIYIRSDITILGFFRSNTEVGIYTLSSKVYTVIKSLLNAVIMVVIPRLSNYIGENEKSKYNVLLNRLQSMIYIFIFPCVTGLFFLSEDIMLIIGGESYFSGYISLKILCIALIFAVFGCFYAQGILVILKKEYYFLRATIISAAINILLNIIIIPLLGIEGAAITTVIAEMAVMIICKYYSKQSVELHNNDTLISIFGGCLTIMIVCLISKHLFSVIFVRIFVSVGLSCILYLLSLIIMRNKIILELINHIKK